MQIHGFYTQSHLICTLFYFYTWPYIGRYTLLLYSSCLETSFICIYITFTLTTLLGLEWLYKYLTKFLGITTVLSHKCLIKTCSSSCLNTFHSNKLAQPEALLADYLIIKSQMFSSVSKANHHTYHLLLFPFWQACQVFPRLNSSSASAASAARSRHGQCHVLPDCPTPLLSL